MTFTVFIFNTSVDICTINGQDLVDYMESLNLELGAYC